MWLGLRWSEGFIFISFFVFACFTPVLRSPCRQFKGEELVPYVPQTTWLSLITTGTKHVVGTKGWLCLEVG